MEKFCMRALALVVAFSGCMVGTVFAGDEGPVVYTMSNAPSGNAVLAFEQHGDTLVPAGTNCHVVCCLTGGSCSRRFITKIISSG